FRAGSVSDGCIPSLTLPARKAFLVSTLLRLALLRGRVGWRGGLHFLLLALDDQAAHLRRLHDAAVDQLVHDPPVELLVLLRQRVLIGVERHHDVLLTRRRVAAKADRHLGHVCPSHFFAGVTIACSTFASMTFIST